MAKKDYIYFACLDFDDKFVFTMRKNGIDTTRDKLDRYCEGFRPIFEKATKTRYSASATYDGEGMQWFFRGFYINKRCYFMEYKKQCYIWTRNNL